MELKNIKTTLDLPNLPDTSKLNECTQRQQCPQCERSVKFFCYKCLIPVGIKEEDLPILDPLPLHLDIIKHNKEIDGKSTALHAKILSPQSVSIWNYPDELPECENPENCLLLFPGPDAITIEEAMKRLKSKSTPEKPAKIERMVVIDGTWSQAKAMVMYSPLISKFQKVQLTYPYCTIFWRYQKFSENYLATIEAIYFFFKEYLEFGQVVEYQPKLENLLYFYIYFYNMIQNRYKSNRDLQFCHRHEGYIKYKDQSKISDNEDSQVESSKKSRTD